MTRVVGNIGVAVNGTLHIKPSAAFVGVDSRYRAYPVADGLVDVDLAPTPKGVYYLVDFQPEGSFNNPSPQERWSIPPAAEIALDSLRFPRSRQLGQTTRTRPILPMVENGVLQQERNDLEKQSKRLKNQVEKLKGSNAQLEARVQSLMAEVAELKTQLYLVQIPQERVIERIERVPVVEKVGNQSLLAQVERLGQKVMALEAENQRLLGMLETAIISQAIPVDEDVMEPEPVFNPGGTPAEKLDYILKQRGQ